MAELMWTQQIEQRGAEIFKGFRITDDVESTYHTLSKYFRNMDGALDLNKGVMIIGGIGTGKTIAMQVFGRLKGFHVVSTRHIVRDFARDGMSALDRYGRESFRQDINHRPKKSEPITVCFDDLGLEDTNSQLYGNKANVMAEVIIDRYEHWRFHSMITHATSNLTLDEVAQVYGDRVMDRINEMMNVVVMAGNSKRNNQK
jgi:hypothetical protein